MCRASLESMVIQVISISCWEDDSTSLIELYIFYLQVTYRAPTQRSDSQNILFALQLEGWICTNDCTQPILCHLVPLSSPEGICCAVLSLYCIVVSVSCVVFNCCIYDGLMRMAVTKHPLVGGCMRRDSASAGNDLLSHAALKDQWTSNNHCCGGFAENTVNALILACIQLATGWPGLAVGGVK